MQSAQRRGEDRRNERRRARRRRRNRVYAKRYRRRLKATGRKAIRAAVVDALIETYDDLVAYLAARRKQLGLTQLELDERAGWPTGYAGKLEAWRGPQGRTASAVALPLWLQALGVRLKPLTETPANVKRPRLNGADLARRVPTPRRPRA